MGSHHLTIPTLSVYAMIEQDEPLAVVYRRGAEGFSRSVLALPDSVAVPEADIELPLSAIYEGIAFEES